MPNSKGTAMEALVAEMLGDIGKLHGSVRALRTEFVELNRVQQKNIDSYVSQTVGKAISDAVANVKSDDPSFFGVKLSFCITLVVVGISIGIILSVVLLRK